MLDTPKRNRLSERREATRREILAEAWVLAQEHGLAGISLRDLAARVGMRAPSLYSYFDSKAAIYDAMFAAGYAEMLRRIDDVELPDDPLERLGAMADVFVQFCVEDPTRYQLLFQRTVPGFEPSPASYAGAVAVLEATRRALAEIGIATDEGLDLWTALLTGLVDQQLSNDPGGDRWVRLLPDAVTMFHHHHRRTT